MVDLSCQKKRIYSIYLSVIVFPIRIWYILYVYINEARNVVGFEEQTSMIAAVQTSYNPIYNDIRWVISMVKFWDQCLSYK